MKSFYEKYGYNVVYDNGSVVYAKNQNSIVIFNWSNSNFELIIGNVKYKFSSFEEVENFFEKVNDPILF